MTPLNAKLRYHVTGAIERGEGKAIEAQLTEIENSCISYDHLTKQDRLKYNDLFNMLTELETEEQNEH